LWLFLGFALACVFASHTEYFTERFAATVLLAYWVMPIFTVISVITIIMVIMIKEVAMITEVSAVKFRQNLGEMLNQVQYRKDSVVVTKDGKPVAVLIDAALGAIRRNHK
jgi:prevent-host-death family protein